MTSQRPKWMEELDKSSSWNNWPGSKDSMDYRKKKPGTDDGTYSVPTGNKNGGTLASGKGHNSDTASLLSGSTRSGSSTDKNNTRKWCLVIGLLILAALVAAGIGCLLYYLLLNDPSPNRFARTSAGTSMTLLNQTFSENMRNKSSPEFRRIAVPFCDEVDAFFMRSPYGDRYNGCRVTELSDIKDAEECFCFGDGPGSTRVKFNLTFRGHYGGDLVFDIPSILDHYVRKVNVSDLIYVFLRDWLVDMRLNWPHPYNSIAADLTFRVYNLTWTPSLAFHNSSAFLSHAQPFCADIDRFLYGSFLVSRYVDCEVTEFKHSPHRISVSLRFRGTDVRPLQTNLLHVILSSAKSFRHQGQPLKLIGDLLITPFIDIHLVPLNVSIYPTPCNGVYVRSTLRTFNVVFVYGLDDPNHPQFKRLALPFCQDLSRMYLQSPYNDIYYNCEVTDFKRDPQSVGLVLVFRGTEWRGVNETLVHVIRRFAPSYVINGQRLYLVGNILVILDPADPAELGPTSLVPLPTSAMTPSVYHNGVRVNTYLRVYNLTFDLSLADPNSFNFKRLAALFCSDMARFYGNSEFSQRYHSCGVDSFSANPVVIFFHVAFTGTDMVGLEPSVVNVIRASARRVRMDLQIFYLVGTLLVLPHDIVISATPTNLTMTSTVFVPGDTPTVDFSVVSTITVSSINYGPHDATLANITYELFKFVYVPELRRKDSDLFQRLELAFCRDMDRFYSASYLFIFYKGCSIEAFEHNPNQVNFHLTFATQASESLKREIIQVLELFAPKRLLQDGRNKEVEVLLAGNLLLIRNIYYIQLIPINHTATPSTLISATPTLPPVYSTDITATTKLTLIYELYNFTYDPELQNPSSSLFLTYHLSLCQDVSNVYSDSPTLRTMYETCRLIGFSTPPDSVRFELEFRTVYSQLLQQFVVRTLELSRPHTLVARGNETLEVLPVGGLYFILGLAGSSISEDVGTPLYPSPPASYFPPSSLLPGGSSVILLYQVYNLAYSNQLGDQASSLFLFHQQTLCKDLDEIFGRKASWDLTSSYESCKLEMFMDGPVRVAFSLTFHIVASEGLGIRVRNQLEYTAPRMLVPGFLLIRVGDLLLIIDKSNVSVVPTSLPPRMTTIQVTQTVDVTETSMMTQGPPILEFLRKANITMTYLLYNFTYTPALAFPSSWEVQQIQSRLCRALELIYRRTIVLGHLFDYCEIIGFGFTPKDVTFRMTFRTEETVSLREVVVETLHKSAPHIFLPDVELLPIAGLLFILKGFTISEVIFTYTATRTVHPTLMPSLPPSNTLVYDATKIVLVYRLVKLDYTPQLADVTSPAFRDHERKFCHDVSKVFRNMEASMFALTYRMCKIDALGRDWIRFYVVLVEGMRDSLKRDVPRTLETLAPKANIPPYIAMDLGDLFLLLSVYNVTIVPTNFTETAMTSTPYVTPTMTSEPASSSVIWPPDGGLAVTLRFGLLDFTYTWHLADRSSDRFLGLQADFCADMDAFYAQSFLRTVYKGCRIRLFSPRPDEVEFEVWLVVPDYPQLAQDVLYVLVERAPKANVTSGPGTMVTVLDVGSLRLIWRNWTIETSTHVQTVVHTDIQPSPTQEPATSSFDLPDSGVVARFYAYLLDFRFAGREVFVGSPLFRYLQDRFCADIQRFYQRSKFYSTFKRCEIQYFGERPDTVDFQLVLNIPVYPELLQELVRVLDVQAPHLNISTIEVLHIGDLFLIWNNFTGTLVPPEGGSVISYTPPSRTPTPTVDIQPSSTVSPPDTSIVAYFKFPLWNFTYFVDFRYPDSRLFREYERNFCKDIELFYTNSVFNRAYRNCSIIVYGYTPNNTVEFQIILDTPWFQGLPDELIRILYLRAPKVNGTGVTVLDVGDLYLLWKYFNVSVVPPGYSTTHFIFIPSTQPPELMPSSTAVLPSLPPWEAFVTAKFRFLLKNFNYSPLLEDSSSALFRLLDSNFCNDIEKFHRRSYLGQAYQGCRILKYGARPEWVEWDVYLDTIIFPGLGPELLRLLWEHAPHVNISDSLTLRVGDLYLIWADYRVWVVPPGGSTTMEVLPPSTPTPVMSTPVMSTTSPPVNWAYGRFNYSLLDFNFRPEFRIRESALFQYFEKNFCKDVAEFYSRSYLGPIFRECKILQYHDQPWNHVLFHVAIETPVMFPGMVDDIYTIFSREAPKLIMQGYRVLDVGDLFLIYDNYTGALVPPGETTYISYTPSRLDITSTTVASSIPIPTSTIRVGFWVTAEMDFGLLNFIYSPRLQFPDSQLFIEYQNNFCEDIRRFYINSGLGMAYRDCKIVLFRTGPDMVRFDIFLDTPMYPGLGEDVLRVLETSAPMRNISGYTVLHVGDLYLIWGNYTIRIVPPEGSTTFVLTPPTPTLPPIVSTTEVLPSATVWPPSNWLLAVFNCSLYDFFYTRDLQSRDGYRFKFLEKDFCDDIEKFYKASLLYRSYRDCRIGGFSENPDTVQFLLAFDTMLVPGLGEAILNVLDTQAPSLNVTRYRVLDVGDLFLIWENYTYILVPPSGVTQTLKFPVVPSTPSPGSTDEITLPGTTLTPAYKIILSFRVLQRFLTPGMQDKSSAEFQNLNLGFCESVDRFVRRWDEIRQNYIGCEIEAFYGDPLRVNFSLKFSGQTAESTKVAVRTLFKEMGERVTVIVDNEEAVGLRFPPLILSSRDFFIPDPSFKITTTPSPDYDAIVYNFTGFVYPDNYSSVFMDRNTVEFYKVTSRFCTAIDGFFNSMYLRNRYHSCYVTGFGDETSRMIRFQVTLNGTEDVGAAVKTVVLQTPQTMSLMGVDWLNIGGLLIYARSSSELPMQYIRWNEISTTALPRTTPGVRTMLELTFRVLNLQFRQELADTSSALFRSISEGFCNTVDKLVTRRNTYPTYVGCTVNGFFRDDPTGINITLELGGSQPEDVRSNLVDILIERAPRYEFNRIPTMNISNLFIYEKTLSSSLLTVTAPLITTPGQPGGRTTPSTPRTTPKPSNPCEGVTDGAVRHPESCQKFFFCQAGVEPQEMACAADLIFDQNKCVREPPGFVCKPKP